MSKNKSMLYALLVMLLWGNLFPMVKLGYDNIVTTGDILFFAGVRFTICGALIYVCTLSLGTRARSKLPFRS